MKPSITMLFSLVRSTSCRRAKNMQVLTPCVSRAVSAAVEHAVQITRCLSWQDFIEYCMWGSIIKCRPITIWIRCRTSLPYVQVCNRLALSQGICMHTRPAHRTEEFGQRTLSQSPRAWAHICSRNALFVSKTAMHCHGPECGDLRVLRF